MRTFAITALVALVGLAGCLESSDDPAAEPSGMDVGTEILDGTILVPDVSDALTFVESVVDAALNYQADLYEPTMEVSDSGAIYVTGHTIGVDTTGAPVFGSYDGGVTWEQLPFTMDQRMPADMHGATPPVSDEIFLVAGDDGYLYGVDITAFAFPVNAWANDGQEHVYYNPNAYDRAESTSTICDGGDGAFFPQPKAASLNDRPWAAYGNGKLLLVNNPGGGPMEIGVMDVPFDTPVGAVGNPATGPVWNLCATDGGWIPGIPSMREDLFFAVPQVTGPGGNSLHLVTGYADDIDNAQQQTVIEFTNTGGGTSNYGQAVFDAEGSLFVAVRNNTMADEEGNRTGQIAMVVSTDDGQTFVNQTLVLDAPTTSIYLDGNMHGEGALLTWAQIGEEGTDWYMAHLFVADNGGIRIENVALVLEAGPSPSAHVQGAAAGPDGRAYLVMYNPPPALVEMPTNGNPLVDEPLHTPLSVYIQQDGPTLPVNTVEEAAAESEA